MNNGKINRRRFLIDGSRAAGLAVGAAGLLPVSGGPAAWAREVAGLTAGEAEKLLRMARLLYPHDALGDDVYARIVEALGRKMAGDAALRTLVAEGLTGLDNGGAGPWLRRPEAAQIAALKAIEETPFFAAVRGHVMHDLYFNKSLWALVGYPGSSLEYGGYINRGFDDIDWLPDDDGKAGQ